jgi:ATP-dependent DNA ligase
MSLHQADLVLPIDTPPMEARLEDSLSSESEEGPWQYEPKWDGFRCLAFKAGAEVELRAKSGKPLGRHFPEIEALLRSLPVARFAIDGELVIELDGHLSFDALQLRLHPAESRIRKLSAETPARRACGAANAVPRGSRSNRSWWWKCVSIM